MIRKKELEEKALYSKWENPLPNYIKDLNGESINMFCHKCGDNQTFNCRYAVFEGEEIFGKPRPKSIMHGGYLKKQRIDGILELKYICAHCGEFGRYFILKVSSPNIVQKIGQYPPINIDLPKEIKSLQKEEINGLYQKGKISENEGYGIGAFAYYRRIIELCINDLLDEIKENAQEKDKEKYAEIINKLKKEKIASNRINLVKNIIIDTSSSQNPLSKIYELCSIGIHQLNDEKCLELAESLRILLIYVVDLIKEGKNKSEGIKKAISNVEKNISELR